MQGRYSRWSRCSAAPTLSIKQTPRARLRLLPSSRRTTKRRLHVRAPLRRFARSYVRDLPRRRSNPRLRCGRSQPTMRLTKRQLQSSAALSRSLVCSSPVPTATTRLNRVTRQQARCARSRQSTRRTAQRLQSASSRSSTARSQNARSKSSRRLRASLPTARRIRLLWQRRAGYLLLLHGSRPLRRRHKRRRRPLCFTWRRITRQRKY